VKSTVSANDRFLVKPNYFSTCRLGRGNPNITAVYRCAISKSSLLAVNEKNGGLGSLKTSREPEAERKNSTAHFFIEEILFVRTDIYFVMLYTIGSTSASVQGKGRGRRETNFVSENR
jgi:hypothetical protein